MNQRATNHSPFPGRKTRIIATIGPASWSEPVIEALLMAGMDVARLNLSHGKLDEHREVVARLRKVAARIGKRLAIMADMPGPKIRIGDMDEEPVDLQAGDPFTLSIEPGPSNAQRAWVDFPPLPRAVRPGSDLFINDGLIQLRVDDVAGPEVHCTVVVGGELRSRKGLNLPGADLGDSAFTDHDRECLRFAAEERLDAVSQSFVNNAEDLQQVRAMADELGYKPFLIAKIERLGALDHIDRILAAADGLMVARGDLGVEIPIERIAVVQKMLIAKARQEGKPVIIATQMLESMVNHRRPTRAEATDVANAILDGCDCVMLSGESAAGHYPREAVAMLAAIARATEPERDNCRINKSLEELHQGSGLGPVDLIALNIYDTLRRSEAQIVLVPTVSGTTARSVSRFRLPVWIVAFSPDEATSQNLQFSYGVLSVAVDEDLDEWLEFVCRWSAQHGFDQGIGILIEGRHTTGHSGSHRFELVDLGDCG